MTRRLVALLGPLVGLVACAGQVTATPPHPDPDVIADAGLDAAIDPPATCDPACADDDRCIDGACAPVDLLNITIAQTVVVYAGYPQSIDNAARACGSLAMAAWNPALPPPLAVEGACKVWSYDPASIPAGPAAQPAASGGVTVTASSATFSLPNMGVDCSTATPELVLFNTPGVTKLDGDGAGHFPAFHLEIPSPTPVQLKAKAIVHGQPLALTWQVAASEDIALEVYTIPKQGSTTPPPWIQCALPDTGSYTIPASLTTLLDPESTVANIFASRATHMTQAPESSPVHIRVYLLRKQQIVLDYTP